MAARGASNGPYRVKGPAPTQHLTLLGMHAVHPISSRSACNLPASCQPSPWGVSAQQCLTHAGPLCILKGLTLPAAQMPAVPGNTNPVLRLDTASSHHRVQACNGSLHITLSGSHTLQNAAQAVPLRLSRPQLLLQAL